jgi:cobalt-zinc-cadmium efflux system membrane fusion protein
MLNELADAKRRVKIARHHLETLLGYPEKQISNDTSVSLSRLELRAPFAGTIESLTFAPSERVLASDSMFVLADTSSLYVSANIRENDWPAVLLQAGQQLTVSAPAVANRCFQATVHYIGRQVDVASNSVPLVATIDNQDGLLRPGMFVRVSVPIGEPHETVAVRPQSVMQHENEQFVFVAMNDRTFRRVGVVTGIATDDWVEVLSGLEPGQRVVDAGAFLLKSELLLEGE